ncbi:SDR family oxidoreductase [Luteipulveratus flavus]|uniref:SDR family NAD(P)-dependent oxidoreductase n=1 Tax=Luteipulveratus flavus TaxID=3031728 RepID=A0ABT6C6F6_9MICO|nr:SDR family oxidoreductase [Luteipulveratus sp. YIM 133296]MDF8264513.1 SDR family NAD(P)-dependent oxidoreductase [Luteipulveratus sp. YIM 133296]
MSAWLGKGVVVTGAARGIGRAIATRLHAEGARLVVADVLDEPLAALAGELDAVAVPGDCASEAGAARLVDQAREALGSIDVWVGNAGVLRGLELDRTSEDDWATSWDVNVMAHVRAARLLLPDWLERGEGRFVVTASAAGLLTMLGAPAYSVTKHATESFAEWLAATYGHRGVSVHAICPQGVRTEMYDQPGSAVLTDIVGHDGALAPEAVADALVDAVAAERFLVLPHPEVQDYLAFRATRTDRWLAGMQALQARVDDASATIDQPDTKE